MGLPGGPVPSGACVDEARLGSARRRPGWWTASRWRTRPGAAASAVDHTGAVSFAIALAIGLAAGSTTLTNLAYLREHDAAAELPSLSMRRPLHSLRLLLADRRWLAGFGEESGGFLLYAGAVGLAPLALVQSINAGGIGVLAYASSRLRRRRLGPRHRAGVLLSVVGLLALGISLTGRSGAEGRGVIGSILLWLGASVALALGVLAVGRRRGGSAALEGVAGGLFFSIGDISTKLVTQGGARIAFVVTLLAGYGIGSLLLQVGYQRGAALTVAGLATLLTNALPILAGTLVLGEPVPRGLLGALRVLAFIAVTAGAVLLAAPEPRRAGGQPVKAPGG